LSSFKPLSPATNFLRTFETLLFNPFLNENFFLYGVEAYTDGQRVHKLCNIKIIYDREIANYKFMQNDAILTVQAFLNNLIDPFGTDDECEVYFNGKLLKISTKLDFNNGGVIFLELFSQIEPLLCEKNILTLKYSNTDYGLSCFTYHRQCLLYIIDENHDDRYYE
jgi:hypothetical protein